LTAVKVFFRQGWSNGGVKGKKAMILTGKIQDPPTDFSKKPDITNGYKTPRTWVLVADGHVARFFEKDKNGIHPIGEAFPDALETEITNKTVGRVASSGSGGIRHKYEPRLGEARQDEVYFIRQLSNWLDRAVQEGLFDRLALIAPPQALGELRQALKKPVRDRVVIEVNKDLTRLNRLTLQEELAKIVWF